MSENKSKRKYIVVAIVAALLLVGGTITAVCIANSNNNAVQVAEQSDNSSVQSSVAESSIENTNTESSAVSENSTKENSATAETSKTAQESSNTSSKAETSKTETSSKPETSKAESSTTTQQSQQPTNNNNQTSKPSTSTETSKPSTPVETSKPSSETSKPSTPTTIAVTSISLDRSSVTLTVGDNVTLVATVNPGSATNKSYEFSSSNNDVATVNSNGTVVAKGKGSCTITVKSSNGKSAKCSVTVKAKASTGNNTSGNNGGTSSTGDKGIASIPAGAKSYQTKSYNGKKTYTVYECPEVVKYINEYRKKAGLKEVKWNTLDYMNQHAYDTVFSIPKEVEYVKRYDPETYEKAFDKNGNYVGAYDYNDWFDATQNNRNAVAYMLGTNAIYHADEHQWSAGIQFTGGSKFSPSSWISNMKTSPDHWEMIMCEDATAVYCTYGVTSNGYFYVAISMI